MPFLILILIAFLAPGAAAGDRTVYGTVSGLPLGDGVHPVPRDQLPALVTSSNELPAINDSLSFPVLFPKFDMRDDNGAPVALDRLQYVEVTLWVGMDAEMWVENTTNVAWDWYHFAQGFRTWLSLHPVGQDPASEEVWTMGGGDPQLLANAAGGLAAHSEFYRHVLGMGHFVTSRHYISANERRLWAGVGRSGLIFFSPRFMQATDGIPGHWNWYGDTRIVGFPFEGQPGKAAKVTYHFEDVSVGNLRIVEGPWTAVDPQLGSSTDCFTYQVHGFTGDPSKVVSVELEVVQCQMTDFGIEDVSSVPGVCGGVSYGGAKYTMPSGAVPVWTNQGRGIGSSNAALGAFDAHVDWAGSSGLLNMSMGPDVATERAQLLSPNDYLGLVPVDVTIGHSAFFPEPLTPGVNFNWRGSHTQFAFVRINTTVRP